MTSTTHPGTAGHEECPALPAHPAASFEEQVRLLTDSLQALVDKVASPKTLTLRQIAARTGISHRLLWDECRAGRLEHYHMGQAYGMTERQFDLLLDLITEGSTSAANVGTDMAQAILQSRSNAGRATGRAA